MKNISKFKKSRIVVPALALAVLTTTAAATSTVAWFAANGTVTASSLSMKATSSADLYIKAGSATNITEIVDYSADLTDQAGNAKASAVKPADVSSSTGSVTLRTAKTYKTTPTYNGAGEVEDWTNIGTISDSGIAAIDDNSVNNYAAYGNVTLVRKTGSDNTNAYDLTITATVKFGTESNINKAVRAGVYINSKFYESDDMNTATGDSVAFTWNTSGKVESLANNTLYKATLLFWLEGDDSDCTQANALTISENTISFTFNSSDHTSA